MCSSPSKMNESLVVLSAQLRSCSKYQVHYCAFARQLLKLPGALLRVCADSSCLSMCVDSRYCVLCLHNCIIECVLSNRAVATVFLGCIYGTTCHRWLVAHHEPERYYVCAIAQIHNNLSYTQLRRWTVARMRRLTKQLNLRKCATQ